MSNLRVLQQRFLGYLRDGQTAIAADVFGATEDQCARRLSIYYNAYRSRLRGVIETDHPVLGLYLGDDGFEQMAAAYIEACPSKFTSLRNYCDNLPAFLAEAQPFARSPILSAIAKFERLLLDAYDAADAQRLSPEFLQTLPADRWPEMTFEFHPSLRSYESTWNSVEIWQALQVRSQPPAAAEGPDQSWLLWRNRERLTEFRSVQTDEHVVLEHAMNGVNFASVCESLLEWHDEIAAAERAFVLIDGWLNQGLLLGKNSGRW